MFLLNLSFSKVISDSFFFEAPGLLFRLLCLILAFPSTVSPLRSVEISGKALAKDSRVVTSFFDGRLCFLASGFDFSILESNDERFERRFSCLELPKALLLPETLFSDGSEAVDFRIELDSERLGVVGA